MPELSSALRELVDRSMTPVDIEAIVGARRRQRLRRRAGSAAVVVVIVTLVTGGVLARPVHEPKTLSVRPEGGTEAEATRAVLGDLTVLSPGGPAFLPFTGSTVRNMNLASHAVNVTDPQSGETLQKPFPIHLPGMLGASVDATVVRGAHLVMMLGSSQGTAPQATYPDRAYVVSSTLDRWKQIGPPAAIPLASLDPDRVWLRGPDTITEVSVDRGSASPSYPLTDHREPLAAVTGGLVTLRLKGKTYVQIIEVWNPATNRVLHTFPAQTQLVAASGDFVVWAAGPACLATCPRHVLDLRTGRERLVALPARMEWDSEAAFAPDGVHVAMVAHDPLPPAEKIIRDSPAAGTYGSTVLVLDGSSGEVAERNLQTWKGRTRLAWSPDGSLVFVVRDGEHLDFFNTTFENSPVREVAVRRADAFLLAAKPTPSTTTRKYGYDGRVEQTRHHSPELCIYATTAIGGPDADDCAGPLIAGWSSTKTSGTFHLVGTYDGHVFTLTQEPIVVASRPPATPDFRSPCATPPGGWQVTNANRVRFDDYTAVIADARAAPDFAGLWFGPNAFAGGVTDLTHTVFNVAFTGSLDAHRTALAQIWGGPICVVHHRHSYAELQRIARELFGAAGRELGLQVLQANPDEVNNVVNAEVVAATDETRRAVEHRFGKGLVNLRSRLRPVP